MTQTLETLGEDREPGPTGGPGGPAGGVPRRDPERASIQSVDRALTLLETIPELGGRAALGPPALLPKGLGRRGYALGARILYLSHACLQVDLPRRAQSALDRINQSTGETVHLAALP